MIDIRFYQAAVVVIPALLIAAGFAGSVFGPTTSRSEGQQRRVSAGWWIGGGVLAACFIIFAELLALISLAADETAMWSFVVVLTAITLLAATLASMAVQRLVEPLRGTWLEGIDRLVVVTASIFAAAAISLALLKS